MTINLKDTINLLKEFKYKLIKTNDGLSIQFDDPTFFNELGYHETQQTSNTDFWLEIIHQSDQKRVLRYLDRIHEDRNVYAIDYRVMNAEGQIRWFHNTYFRIPDASENQPHGYGLLIDITGYKKAEDTVKTSEGKYQSIIEDVLESSPVALSILDPALNIVWINQAYEKIFNLKKKDTLGHQAGEILINHMRPLFSNAERVYTKILDSYDNNTYIEQFECYIQKTERTRGRWLMHWSKPIETGQLSGGRVEYYSDITEYKKMIQAAEENEARSQQLLNHLTDYVFNVKVEEGEAKETFHGPGCVAVTGYSQEELQAEPELWIQMVLEKDRPYVETQAAQAILGQKVKPLEHRIVRKDGTIRWVRSTIVLRKNENGELISYDGLITDITELKQAELLAASQREQLIQADKLATLGILVSGVAHEINNPNNFIMLNSNMISKVWKDVQNILNSYYESNGEFAIAGMPYSTSCGKVGELIDGIGKGARRIEKIVSSLKDFSKQDTGELKGTVDVKRMIETVTLILNNMIKKSTKNFHLNLEENLPTIEGNFQKLEQVIMNLITNACQALPDPQKALYVNAKHLTEENRIQIEIKDEGTGISEEDLKHIVDPFFTTKRDRGGTGLGLSIAYNIIKDHQGQMNFKSELNKGTQITLLLPIKQAMPEEETT